MYARLTLKWIFRSRNIQGTAIYIKHQKGHFLGSENPTTQIGNDFFRTKSLPIWVGDCISNIRKIDSTIC